MTDMSDVKGITGTSANLNSQTGLGGHKPNPQAGSSTGGGHKPPSPPTVGAAMPQPVAKAMPRNVSGVKGMPKGGA